MGTKIEGSVIRQLLRSRGLRGGNETICCGGKKKFSRDYTEQLKKLGYKGNYTVTENGIVVDHVIV